MIILIKHIYKTNTFFYTSHWIFKWYLFPNSYFVLLEVNSLYLASVVHYKPKVKNQYCTKYKKFQLPCCTKIHHEITIRDTRGPSQFFAGFTLLGHVVGPCMGLARRQASLVAGTHPDLSLNCRQPARLRCSKKAELTLQCTQRGLAKQQMPPRRPGKKECSFISTGQRVIHHWFDFGLGHWFPTGGLRESLESAHTKKCQNKWEYWKQCSL